MASSYRENVRAQVEEFYASLSEREKNILRKGDVSLFFAGTLEEKLQAHKLTLTDCECAKALGEISARMGQLEVSWEDFAWIREQIVNNLHELQNSLPMIRKTITLTGLFDLPVFVSKKPNLHVWYDSDPKLIKKVGYSSSVDCHLFFVRFHAPFFRGIQLQARGYYHYNDAGFMPFDDVFGNLEATYRGAVCRGNANAIKWMNGLCKLYLGLPAALYADKEAKARKVKGGISELRQIIDNHHQ